MARVYSHGWMAGSMRASTMMTRSTERAHFNGQMVRSIREIGCMVNNMDLDFTGHQKMQIGEKVNG